MLHIKFSNRFESLLDALLDGMGSPPASPFESTEIIVPSVALRRAVELSAADRYGICANVRFSFLAQWLWRQIDQVVAVGELSPFAPPVLAWRAYRIFGDGAFVAAYPPLQNYLGNADDVMRLDLAIGAAALLDQYITYRPDWLATWSDGKSIAIPGADAALMQDQRWQAALWRRITDELATSRRHPAVAFLEAIENAGGDPTIRARLPSAAHVFCLPTMPRLYVDLLRRLGRWMEVELYVLNPSREYWFDIVDPRRLTYLATRGKRDHHEVGNRLLAAWGKQTQAHLGVLFDDSGDTSVDDDRFVYSTGNTLLSSLQNAMLDLVELRPGSLYPLADDDRSIEVHVCHSLTRQLEVLHDQLLALLAGAAPPRLADILVVTPDLEAAAPLIDAIFRNASASSRIPYTITGRARSTVNPVARALLDLLAMATSRFPASTVFELLQQSVVGQRFGIDDAALDTVHAWINAAAIRWGIDAEHRASFDVPPFAQHSFRAGFDRLFLGYALPIAIDATWNDALPAGNAEGSEALALGCFWHFFEELERLHVDLSRPRPAGEWTQALSRVLDTFVLPDDDAIEDLREVQDAIRELHDNLARGGLTEALPVELVRVALQSLLDDPARGGVPTGTVTFSAMASLRNLPYRFIGVIGLDDGAYPHLSRPAQFDLMALAPRRGDRELRNDERNTFLDLLLAARSQLYLSYTGRSIRDNTRLPPSVLVAELLDCLVPAIAADPHATDARDRAYRRLVVEHPLQPFSMAYFATDADPRIRSFNGEYCAALQSRLSAPVTLAVNHGDSDDDDVITGNVATFFQAPLAAPDEDWREVSLDQLTRFLHKPADYLLVQRLGIGRAQSTDELQDDEPFLSDYAGRMALGERLLPALLAGRGRDEVTALARAGGEFPPGHLGAIALARELELLWHFATRVRADSTAPVLPPIAATFDFLLDGERWRLHGSMGDVRASGLVRSRYDDTRAGDYLAGWIAHLFLNAVRPPGVTRQTRWHSRDGAYTLPPLDDASAHLQTLLALYRDGLRAPLHFFPKSAWQYVTSGERLTAASTAWHTSRAHPFGEDRALAYRLAMRGVAQPLDDAFVDAARAVFGPLLAVLDDGRLQ